MWAAMQPRDTAPGERTGRVRQVASLPQRAAVQAGPLTGSRVQRSAAQETLHSRQDGLSLIESDRLEEGTPNHPTGHQLQRDPALSCAHR